MLQDRRGLLEGVVGRDAPVGPDLEDELVVIGDLADAGVFDGVLDEADRGEERIDGDDADGLIFLLVLLARAIAAAGLDLDLGLEGLLVERADDLVGVDDRDVGIGLDVGGGDGTRLAVTLIWRVIGSRFWETIRIFFRLSTMSVTSSTTPSMLWNSWLTPSILIDEDGGTLDGAEQHAAEGVADGVAVAGLEGLGDELGVGRRGAFLDLGELVGEFELSETFGHGDDSGFWAVRVGSGSDRLEAGVELDDQLLVDPLLHLIARRETVDVALKTRH
jgi:hypothetical protein